MATPSGCPSTITPVDNPQYPHIIPSDEDSIFSKLNIPITTEINYVFLPPTKDPTIEPSG